MKPRAALVASASLGLLLTGCPLTDNYQLLQEGLGGSATLAGGGPNVTAGAGSDAAETAGTASAGTSSGSACAKDCYPGRACVAGSCTSGWVGMAPPPVQIEARSKAASVAIGRAVFIWGGLDNNGAALNNGAIYQPGLDKWTPLPADPGSPSARIMATAVWTGNTSNKVIVYGGTDASGMITYRDGAVYDLLDNSWVPLPPNPMIKPRSASFGYWDGTHAVFFGGLNGTAMVGGADRFDLKLWSPSTITGDPGLLGYSALAVDGAVMYLQGGVIGGVRQDKVYSYSSSADTWASLSKSLSVRTGGFGAWGGTSFVVWGGQDDAGLREDGKAMTGATWSNMTSPSVISARRIGFGRSGWAFQAKPGVIAIFGGQTSITGLSSGALATDGATYAVESGRWTKIPDWSSLESHESGIGVWTGEEFVIWGGRNQNVSTLTGERWAP